MSETPEKAETPRLSLRKQPVARPSAGGTGDQPSRLPTPRTIDLALIALVVTALGLIARALTLLGGTDMLRAYMIKSNNDAAADKKKTPYGPTQIAHDIHAYRQGALLMGFVIAAALVLLIFAFRRARTASGASGVASPAAKNAAHSPLS